MALTHPKLQSAECLGPIITSTQSVAKDYSFKMVFISFKKL